MAFVATADCEIMDFGIALQAVMGESRTIFYFSNHFVRASFAETNSMNCEKKTTAFQLNKFTSFPDQILLSADVSAESDFITSESDDQPPEGIQISPGWFE